MHTARIRDAVLLGTIAIYSAGYTAVGLGVIFLLAIIEGISRTWRWVSTGLDRPLIGVAVAAVLSALFSHWRGHSMALVVLLLVAMVVSVRTVAAYAITGAERCLWFLRIWVAGGAAAALWTIMQFDPSGRIPATTPALGPNGIGTTLAVAAVIALSLLASRSARPWLLIGGLAAILAGLVGTWSRGAWLGAAVGSATVLAIGVSPRVRLAVAALLVLLMGLGGVLHARWPELSAEVRSIGSLEANRNRIVIWKTAPRMIKDHPLVGTGYGTFEVAYPRYRPPDAPDLTPPTAHNLFLNAAVEMGLIGLVAMVALCGAGLVSARRWLTRSPPRSQEGAVASATLAALAALLANQLVDGTVMSVHIGFGFFALMTLGAVGNRYLTVAREVPGAQTAHPAPESRPGRTR